MLASVPAMINATRGKLSIWLALCWQMPDRPGHDFHACDALMHSKPEAGRCSTQSKASHPAHLLTLGHEVDTATIDTMSLLKILIPPGVFVIVKIVINLCFMLQSFCPCKAGQLQRYSSHMHTCWSTHSGLSGLFVCIHSCQPPSATAQAAC